MPSAGCCAARQAAADGADRQGHPHLGLHDRVGAGGRVRLGRRRRAAQRPAADAGRGLPDARAAARPGRGHQRLAQPLRRQRHQVLLGPRREAARRLGARGRGGAGGAAAVGATRPALGKARRLDDAGGRYIEFCKSTVPHRPVAARAEDGRRRARMARPTTWRPTSSTNSAPRCITHRLRARRPEHQRRRRCHRAAGPGRARCAEHRRRLRHRARRRRRPAAAGRRARAGSSTATNCCT